MPAPSSLAIIAQDQDKGKREGEMAYQKKTDNPNMGRPKIGSLTHDVRIRVDDGMYWRMQKICQKREISLSEISREAIREYLEKRG